MLKFLFERLSRPQTRALHKGRWWRLDVGNARYARSSSVCTSPWHDFLFTIPALPARAGSAKKKICRGRRVGGIGFKRSPSARGRTSSSISPRRRTGDGGVRRLMAARLPTVKKTGLEGDFRIETTRSRRRSAARSISPHSIAAQWPRGNCGGTPGLALSGW